MYLNIKDMCATKFEFIDINYTILHINVFIFICNIKGKKYSKLIYYPLFGEYVEYYLSYVDGAQREALISKENIKITPRILKWLPKEGQVLKSFFNAAGINLKWDHSFHTHQVTIQYCKLIWRPTWGS